MITQKIHELDLILGILQKDQRMMRLKRLADELGMFPKNQSGAGLNEQQLVLAIYDGFVAQETQNKKRRKDLAVIFLSIVFIISVAVFSPRIFVKYFRYIEAGNEAKRKAYIGYDDKRKIIKDETGQPVLFYDMEGIYYEFYNDGAPHFEFRYEAGNVVEQRELDRKGRLIAHFIFDEEGNPTLVEEE